MPLLTQIATDLDTFLADFGEDQVLTPAGGAAIPFTGIASIGFKQIELPSGSVISFDAEVVGKTSVIGTAKQGDAVTLTSALNSITAAAYTVTVPQNSPEDLGPGLTRLALRKA